MNEDLKAAIAATTAIINLVLVTAKAIDYFKRCKQKRRRKKR